MRRIIPSPLFLCLALLFTGQQKVMAQENFFLLDGNLKGTTMEKAKYLVHAVKQNDTCWQFDTYNMYGPMISSEKYKDEKGSEANGKFIYFNKKGGIDSSGSFVNGFQDGDWHFYNSKDRLFLIKKYKTGDVIEITDSHKIDSLEKVRKDSLDKSPQTDEFESDFAGGVNGWIKYLTENLKYPERAMNINKQGTVVIQFIVDKEGHVLSPEIVQSVEYSIDQEALRLIKDSPVWKPAMQFGKKVKSYKKQPLTFRLQ